MLIVVVIVIAVVIPVPHVAAFARFLELVTPLFRLAAMFAVLTNRLFQVFLRLMNAPAAFVITVRMGWNRRSSQQGNANYSTQNPA